MGVKTFQLIVAASVSSVLSYHTLWWVIDAIQDGALTRFLFEGSICLGLFLMGLACLDMARYSPSDSHTIRSMVSQYVVEILVRKVLARRIYNDLIAQLKDVKGTQDKTLMRILERNANTVYGRDNRLSDIKSREEYVKKFPLTDFSHIEKYVERIANGEENILTKDKVELLCLSSGTTGKNKMYPRTHTDTRRIAKLFICKAHVLNDIHYNKIGLRRVLEFKLFHPSNSSPGGVPMGGISSLYLKSFGYNVVPAALMSITKEHPSFYVQAAFSLADPDLAAIQGFSSDLLLSFFKFMEHNHADLCEDIERGKIRSMENVTDDTLSNLNQHFVASPARAHQLRSLFTTGNKGIGRRIWPNLCLAGIVKSGGFAHSAQMLAESYLENVAMYFAFHGGTEGMHGMLLDSDTTSNDFTLIPTVNFMEFIPIEQKDDPNPETLFMDQLEVGKVYEIVATNSDGLYRNRFGDVIKVVGFHGNTPKYNFMYRTGQILNIAYDRTPEKALYEAVSKCAKLWQQTIAHYTACESFHMEKITGESRERGRYVVFLELAADHVISEEENQTLEDTLCKQHEAYGDMRQQGSVDPLHIVQVNKGTFEGLRSLLMGERQNDQFKMPRVLRKQEGLKYLWEHKV